MNVNIQKLRTFLWMFPHICRLIGWCLFSVFPARYLKANHTIHRLFGKQYTIKRSKKMEAHCVLIVEPPSFNVENWLVLLLKFTFTQFDHALIHGKSKCGEMSWNLTHFLRQGLQCAMLSESKVVYILWNASSWYRER